MNRQRKTITLGDKIFARVSHNGQTIFNYVSEKVATMSQLLNEIRFAIKDIHGLVMIHIRNYHQGWGEDRPLMLYAEKVRNTSTFLSNHPEVIEREEAAPARMLFPWDTH